METRSRGDSCLPAGQAGITPTFFLELGLSWIFKSSQPAASGIEMALDRKGMPPFLTPPFDHIPSVLGTHFFSKAMRAFSFNIGLIRQRLLHGIPYVLIPIMKSGIISTQDGCVNQRFGDFGGNRMIEAGEARFSRL